MWYLKVQYLYNKTYKYHCIIDEQCSSHPRYKVVVATIIYGVYVYCPSTPHPPPPNLGSFHHATELHGLFY